MKEHISQKINYKGHNRESSNSMLALYSSSDYRPTRIPLEVKSLLEALLCHRECFLNKFNTIHNQMFTGAKYF